MRQTRGGDPKHRTVVSCIDKSRDCELAHGHASPYRWGGWGRRVYEKIGVLISRALRLAGFFGRSLRRSVARLPRRPGPPC